MAIDTRTLCPGGGATLEAHDKRITKNEEDIDELKDTLQGNTKLLVATLVGVIFNLFYMMIGQL